MKTSAIAVFFALASLSVASNAATPANVAVYATEKYNGSMFVEGTSVYTKTFDVVIANLSEQSADLSKLCLKAYSPDNEEFMLDTVDEILTKGTLKGGKSVKSFAMFSSEYDIIYKAALIKISDNCS